GDARHRALYGACLKIALQSSQREAIFAAPNATRPPRAASLDHDQLPVLQPLAGGDTSTEAAARSEPKGKVSFQETPAHDASLAVALLDLPAPDAEGAVST